MGEAQLTIDRARAGHPPSRIELRLSLDPAPPASSEVRRALAVFHEALPAETLSDLRLIVTELVTNGVKYGPGERIEVCVALAPGGLPRGGVADGGAGPIATAAVGNPRGGGLGLLIVDALCSSWGVDQGSGQVWFELGA